MIKSNFIRTVYSSRNNMDARIVRTIRHPFRKASLMLWVGISILCMSTIVFAQTTGKISGVVTDVQSGEPLIGANVVIVGSSLGAATDVDGAFFILNIPAGKYDLQVSMVGYERIIQRDVIVNSGRTTTADFKIKATTIEQPPIIIEAIRPDVEKEKTSTSAIMRSDEVKQLAGMHDVSDVIKLTADVTDGHFRGGRDNEELYTLQGAGLNNPIDNSQAMVPIMSAVEEVEVITSGFDAQYGNAQSGVVNISMKEGKSDKWRSYAELRMRTPGRKHFGPSVYDDNANGYLRLLEGEDIWVGTQDGGMGYFSGMRGQSRLGNDTSAQLAAARALWGQIRRGINRDYGKSIDYTGEFSTGGPINDNMRMFLAFNNDTEWPVFPTEHPDLTLQVMSNVVADLGGGSTLRLSGVFAQENTNVFPSKNATGYERWIWNLIEGVQVQKKANAQFGVRYTKAFSQSTFLEIKLNTLLNRTRMGSSPVTPDAYIGVIGGNSANWMASSNTGPDRFSNGNVNNNYKDDKARTYSVDASITSQITKSHLLNAGVQANFYKIDVNDLYSFNVLQSGGANRYSAMPKEASLYVQDKMEFEGMIAKVGLRFDGYDESITYIRNPYTPQADSTRVKVPLVGRLQPRVGISFPVSENTVFHLNYGSFVQRPSFQYFLPPLTYNTSWTTGNPALEPEVTYQYDVGVTQGLGEGFTFDASGYYKNVNNQIEQAKYQTTEGSYYVSYVNRDYADIRGFRLSLLKRKGSFNGAVNYHYSVATGKSAAPGQAMPVYQSDGSVNTKSIPLRDILLDFDRTHNVIINLSYITDDKFGFDIGGFYPLGDVLVSTYSFARSGRPYTSSELSGQALANNKRAPFEYNTNLKVTKRVRNFYGTTLTFYLEVINLFDNKILNYDYVFTGDASTLRAYENYPIDNPNGIRYQSSDLLMPPGLPVDYSFLIYSNQPRAYYLGVSVEF